LQKVGQNFSLHKISEKFSRNSFFLKLQVRISIEFGTKHEKFQAKRTSIHLGKKSNNFTHKQTFLSAQAMMNKTLLPILWDESGAQISAKTQ